jgi:hypothetical protein
MTEMPKPLYCANHPSRETSLRCNRCEKPICSKCAVRTPTGYRCRECVKSQQRVFETAEWFDYPLGFAIAVIISYIGSLIAPKMGFFVLFLAPLVGVIIAEATRFATRRRRSKTLFLVISAGALFGSLPSLVSQVLPLLFLLPQAEFAFGSLYTSIWHGAYVIMVTSTVYYRVSGLVFNR